MQEAPYKQDLGTINTLNSPPLISNKKVYQRWHSFFWTKHTLLRWYELLISERHHQNLIEFSPLLECSVAWRYQASCQHEDMEDMATLNRISSPSFCSHPAWLDIKCYIILSLPHQPNQKSAVGVFGSQKIWKIWYEKISKMHLAWRNGKYGHLEENIFSFILFSPHMIQY